jgi:hypothetical protein
MKKYLAITIDVEPDCGPNWLYSDPLTFKGVSSGIGEKIQPLCQRYGMKPTYLINNVVMEDAASVDFLKSLVGMAELGTHLHPEFIEPEKKFENYAGRKGIANCCFYPPEIEKEKISNITTLFRHAFAYSPHVFRAGRFSAGPNTIKCLLEAGYKVDTSVTPHVCWNDISREMPVDFSDAPEQPYFIKQGSILDEDPNAALLEVPVTIGLQPRNPLKELISSAGGLRHSYRKTRAVWLRPFYSSADQMKLLVEQYIARYSKQDMVIFNMMFHNVEVLPGLSPYTQTEAGCASYLEQLESFFSFCRRTEIVGAGLSELYNVIRK